MFKSTIDESLQSASTHGKELIDYAAEKLGAVIDDRIEKAKLELGALITEKLAEVKRDMTDVASMQKQSAIRNMSISIAGAIAVATVSYAYKTATPGEIDLYSLFRIFIGSIIAGQIIWLISRAVSNAINMSKLKREAMLYAAQFAGAFKIQGLVSHLLILLLLIASFIAMTIVTP